MPVDVEVRAMTAGDSLLIGDLLARCMSAERISNPLFWGRVLLDPNIRSSGIAVAATPAGGVVGCAIAVVERRPVEDGTPDTERGWVTAFAVDEAWRRQGIGTRLLEFAENYVRKAGRTIMDISAYAPGYFVPGVDGVAYPEALAFLKSRGYASTARPLSMSISLPMGWQIPPFANQLSIDLQRQGIHVHPVEPHQLSALLHFLRAEFPGPWQAQVRGAVRDILAQRRHGSDLLAASRGDEILGFAHCFRERFGPFGVAQAERGKGIGITLLARMLQHIQARGGRHAWFMWSDDASAARVYTPMGFVESRRFDVMRKQLDSSSGV
ncbi:MAG: GNAT family N-acetyltransferase [Armatimonadetes bacterium]|nr:GNAT family N-acetyltransferase [Armatimonadota bacterium]MDE2205943.1 GNAT family N-acetyltransferase [Armatimonadota bacterium]